MFVTSNVYLNIMFLHIACGFEILHNPFKEIVECKSYCFSDVIVSMSYIVIQ